MCSLLLFLCHHIFPQHLSSSLMSENISIFFCVFFKRYQKYERKRLLVGDLESDCLRVSAPSSPPILGSNSASPPGNPLPVLHQSNNIETYGGRG